MELRQPKQTHNVDPGRLGDLLRDDLRPRHERSTLIPHLHALIDMGRIQGDLRVEVEKRLEVFSSTPLLDDPRYEQLKQHGALLVSGLKHDDVALLDEWGACNGEIISAWIVSEMRIFALIEHLRQAVFAYDMNNVRYLLRFYDPLITPVLHRLADKKWVDWFFSPMRAWWYPVATPTEETWSRIAGGGKLMLGKTESLVLTEELWDALKSDPFPYRLLNFAEQKYPSFFESDCYGVRLAKVESLLETGKKQGLNTQNDLTAYVLALLEDPMRAEEPRWLEAVQRAVAGYAPLKNYFAI